MINLPGQSAVNRRLHALGLDAEDLDDPLIRLARWWADSQPHEILLDVEEWYDVASRAAAQEVNELKGEARGGTGVNQ